MKGRWNNTHLKEARDMKCPSCWTHHNETVCPSCGFGAPPEPKVEQEVEPHPDDKDAETKDHIE